MHPSFPLFKEKTFTYIQKKENISNTHLLYEATKSAPSKKAINAPFCFKGVKIAMKIIVLSRLVFRRRSLIISRGNEQRMKRAPHSITFLRYPLSLIVDQRVRDMGRKE